MQKKKKKKDRKSSRTRQKNKGGDSTVESNDSSEILDRAETSGIPGLPSGVIAKEQAGSRAGRNTTE